MDLDRLHPERRRIHPEAFIAQGAVVIGDVLVEELASVWFNAVVRADMARIHLGPRVNVQDGSVLHVDEGCPLTLEEGVSVGHLCIVHGCTVRRGALIGMGSVIMNGVEVGEDSLVGAGSLLTEGRKYPPRSLILGRPGKIIRELTDEDVVKLRRATDHYAEAGRAYRLRGMDAR